MSRIFCPHCQGKIELLEPEVNYAQTERPYQQPPSKPSLPMDDYPDLPAKYTVGDIADALSIG